MSVTPNTKIDIRLACIIDMHNSFYENNPRSNKHRPTPIVRPVNRFEGATQRVSRHNFKP